ncbi:MAG: DUF1553 domain-containing protein [Pirellula sp.]
MLSPWSTAVFCGLVVGYSLPLAAQSVTTEDENLQFFESKVRPLLIEKCLECHSAKESSGGLSLEAKEGWQHGGDSGPAIDLDHWDKSLIWKAVQYRNPHLQMPPESKLADSQIDVFRTWISQGAFDPRTQATSKNKDRSGLVVENAQQHWAYRKIQRPSVEPSKAAGHPIDVFLTAQQNAAEIQPADKATWPVLLQRLSVDLHGLRPGMNWLSDNTVANRDQYEKVVDELLASPRFGERFARHWMDAVRFAESITLRGFVLPDAWRYRNYLIRSFNADKPANEFLREQIAGDLMAAANLEHRRDQLTATTMLALGDTNLEEQDKKQLEMDYVDEQLDMIGKVFLGQTIGCARCHDHKFDPIPTRDYYALAGILKSSVALEHSNVSNWVKVPLPMDPESAHAYEQMESSKTKIKKQQDELKKLLQSEPKGSLVRAKTELDGIVIDDVDAKRVGQWHASDFVKAFVGVSYLHDGAQDKGTKTITFEPKSIRPGTYKVRLSFATGTNRTKSAMVRVFSADGEDVVRVDQSVKPKDDGLWQTLGTYRFEQGGQAFVIVSNEDSVGHVVADAVQFLAESNPATPPGDKLASAQPTPSRESADEMRKKVAELDSELKALQSKLDARPAVMSVRPLPKPMDLAIHVRGSVHQLGAVVPRGFLSCASESSQTVPISSDSNGRLELANWITSSENPLTARVYVNRIWSWLMGDGIVRTVDNFGTTGEPPSNPELLDWLTSEFIAQGWSTKWLVREIVLSNAYQLASQAPAKTIEQDPDNRTFARGTVRRLDAESIRDTLLNISGELDLAASLDSVIPLNTKEDYQFKHQVRYRSVYGPVFRNSPLELYTEFDGANTSFPVSKRSRSTVAPQALAVLNSHWVAERVCKFARRLSDISTSKQSRVDACFAAIVSRHPTREEREWATGLIGAEESAENDDSVWISLVHSLIASLDFRFIE